MSHKDLFVWGFFLGGCVLGFFFLFLKEHGNILQVSYQATLNAKWAFNIQLSMKQLDTPGHRILLICFKAPDGKSKVILILQIRNNTLIGMENANFTPPYKVLL